MKKNLHLIAAAALAIVSVTLFFYCWHAIELGEKTKRIELPMPAVPRAASSTPPSAEIVKTVIPGIQPIITFGTAKITAQSPKIFAYAHGTVAADGKLFIGMADKAGNPFPTNEVLIFSAADISRAALLPLRAAGDIETMIYDDKNDMIYFLLSSNSALKVYGMNPKNYFTYAIASTSAVDAGRKPAIVTDGKYIYGITDTNPSKVFRVGVRGEGLMISSAGHIPNGHSAAIGIFGSSTELYFGGGMSNGFEKADAATLAPVASTKFAPCNMSDDVPFVKADDSSKPDASFGYVYIGCETMPYGIRVKTSDLSFERFSLPGASMGLFVYGNDLYNAATDGTIDVFPGGDLADLHRYKLVDGKTILDTKGQDPSLNEILYSPEANKLYFTAWWGIKGLYEISTSTDI